MVAQTRVSFTFIPTLSVLYIPHNVSLSNKQ